MYITSPSFRAVPIFVIKSNLRNEEKYLIPSTEPLQKSSTSSRSQQASLTRVFWGRVVFVSYSQLFTRGCEFPRKHNASFCLHNRRLMHETP